MTDHPDDPIPPDTSMCGSDPLLDPASPARFQLCVGFEHDEEGLRFWCDNTKVTGQAPPPDADDCNADDLAARKDGTGF